MIKIRPPLLSLLHFFFFFSHFFLLLFFVVCFVVVVLMPLIFLLRIFDYHLKKTKQTKYNLLKYLYKHSI